MLAPEYGDLGLREFNFYFCHYHRTSGFRWPIPNCQYLVPQTGQHWLTVWKVLFSFGKKLTQKHPIHVWDMKCGSAASGYSDTELKRMSWVEAEREQMRNCYSCKRYCRDSQRKKIIHLNKILPAKSFSSLKDKNLPFLSRKKVSMFHESKYLNLNLMVKVKQYFKVLN